MEASSFRSHRSHFRGIWRARLRRRVVGAVAAMPAVGQFVGTVARPKRREWTKDDVRELKSLSRQKTPVAKIAKSFKRTLRATQQKAYSLGVSLDSRS